MTHFTCDFSGEARYVENITDAKFYEMLSIQQMGFSVPRIDTSGVILNRKSCIVKRSTSNKRNCEFGGVRMIYLLTGQQM
jgi:hypothetical protein